ncbi:MAG TPA: ABC transporter ATP-binding protein [Gemmatimonadota bacterium]|jgi:putative ABC transport system ATP-binding protein
MTTSPPGAPRTAPAAAPPGSPAGPLVQAERLSRRFAREGVPFAALHEVTFEVRRGEFGVLVGRSGSGKTTLLNLLGGLDRPTAGRVVVDGLELGRLPDRTLSRFRNEKVGFVFQAFHLRNAETALENVLTPFLFARGRQRDVRARGLRALAAVGLSELAQQRGSTLSAGQRQRVAIARAIVRDPVLLLADEPTGNLDAETGAGVIDLLARLNRERGTTVLVATHDADLTAAATLVLALRDGRLVEGPR